MYSCLFHNQVQVLWIRSQRDCSGTFDIVKENEVSKFISIVDFAKCGVHGIESSFGSENYVFILKNDQAQGMICGDLKTKEIKPFHIKTKVKWFLLSLRVGNLRKPTVVEEKKLEKALCWIAQVPKIGWANKVSRPVHCKALCWVGYRDRNRDVWCPLLGCSLFRAWVPLPALKHNLLLGVQGLPPERRRGGEGGS